MRLKTVSAAVVLAALLACRGPSTASLDTSRRIDGPSDYTVYWDLPETDRYWVPKGTEVARIVEIGKQCEAKIDGGISHHILVPPAYDYFVFHFIGPVSDAAKGCVTARLKAIPVLTVYEKKR